MKHPENMNLAELMEATRLFNQELETRIRSQLSEIDRQRTGLLNAMNALNPAAANGMYVGSQPARLALAGPAPARHGGYRERQPSVAFQNGVPGSVHGGVKITVNGPRYRNPNDEGQTWTGIGKMPRWLKALTAKGRSRDDFIIPGSKPPTKRGGAMSRLARVQQGSSRAISHQRMATARVTPARENGLVFSNPFKPSERWNGQGTQPEWFRLARRNGYTVEEMSIGGPIPKDFYRALKTPGAVYKGPEALQRAMKDVAASLKGRAGAGSPGVPRPVLFRNPDDPSETWAGGGTRPRWFEAKLQEGRRPQEFLVEGAEMPDRDDLRQYVQPTPGEGGGQHAPSG